MIDVVVRSRQNRDNVAACLEASKQVRAVYTRRVFCRLRLCESIVRRFVPRRLDPNGKQSNRLQQVR